MIRFLSASILAVVIVLSYLVGLLEILGAYYTESVRLLIHGTALIVAASIAESFGDVIFRR